MEYSSPQPDTDSSFVETLLDRQGSKTSKSHCPITKQVSKRESLTSEDSLLGGKEGRRCSVTFKEPLDSTILIHTESDPETASACDSEETCETAKLLSAENVVPEIVLSEDSEITNVSNDSESGKTENEEICQISFKKTKLTKQCSLNHAEPSLETTQNFKRSYTVPSPGRAAYSRPVPNSEKPDECPASSDPHDSPWCRRAESGLEGEQPVPPPRKNSRPAEQKDSGGEGKAKKSGNPFAIRRQASFMLRRSSWRASRFRSKSQGASTTKSKWDRSDRKEDDTSSTVPRVEMVPESGGCPSAHESASQAAQEILISSPGSSKARQKKFHRHFKTVPPDEKVLNYYSCALVADILLQGHLYITRNYFAFYSNVFGYVTKLLIPTTSVLKVTKEKTAYIIPNAVGVTTEEEKHVFGSLLSRDSTYKLMVQVWNAALAPTINALPKPECIEERLKDELEEPVLQDEESSLSGSESNLESKLISNSVDSPPKGNTQTMDGRCPWRDPPPLCLSDIETRSLDTHPSWKDINEHLMYPAFKGLEVKSYHDMFSQTTSSGCGRAPFLTFLKGLPRPTLLLLISTGLLVLLFASATVLLYRIARLHQAPVDFSTRSMSEVHAYINSNLEHITKVRESLEKLSFLIEQGGKYHS